MAWRRGKFTLIVFVLQVLFIALFAIFVEYDKDADSRYDHSARRKDGPTAETMHVDPSSSLSYYPMFQDVHVMIFVGFGFLMTFLRRYSFSSMGFNFLIASFVLQWATLMGGFLHLHDGKIQVNMVTLLTADFASAAVLITFGACLGRLSPLQMIICAILEIAVFQVNEWVGLSKFKAVDVGGSMFVHVFGAYFGMAVAAVTYRKGEVESVAHKEVPVYNSDLFSLIGTIFLWMFWPSFNSALAHGDDQHRAVINTYFALAACCVTTFAFSALLNKDDKFEVEHIQNATLAGGVAVGTVADFMINPWAALVIGCSAGIVSTVGFQYLTPYLADTVKLHDSCGVNNLHGVPGLMAGVAGVILTSMVDINDYGDGMYQLFPAMVPKANTTEYAEFSKIYDLPPGDGRTSSDQAKYQLIALGVTLAAAVVGGAITGLILRLPIWNRPERHALFEDVECWLVPDGYPSEEHDLVPPEKANNALKQGLENELNDNVIANDNTKV